MSHMHPVVDKHTLDALASISQAECCRRARSHPKKCSRRFQLGIPADTVKYATRDSSHSQINFYASVLGVVFIPRFTER